MTDIDTLVQGTMMDRSIGEPLDRAVVAVAQIEQVVWTAAGLEVGTPLPIPTEWEHKVPANRAEQTDWANLSEGDVGIGIFDTEDVAPRKRWWQR